MVPIEPMDVTVVGNGPDEPPNVYSLRKNRLKLAVSTR
jgi:hypothetical protein